MNRIVHTRNDHLRSIQLNSDQSPSTYYERGNLCFHMDCVNQKAPKLFLTGKVHFCTTMYDQPYSRLVIMADPIRIVLYVRKPIEGTVESFG